MQQKMYWKRKDVNGAIRYKLYAPAAMDADDFKDVDAMPIQTMEKYKERLWQMFYNMDAIQQEWVWFTTRDKDTGWSGDVLPPSQMVMPVNVLCRNKSTNMNT